MHDMQTLHLFAGAGGGLLGDLILGHTPIGAVEFDPYCCAVLRERAADGWFPGLRVHEGDIRLFDPSEYAGRVDCLHAGFPASLTASLASERAKLTSVICGPTPAESLASYDRDSCCWKTSQASFLTDTPPLSSENFPRWGMTVGGRLFPLPMLELRTGASGGGALLNVPTPTTIDSGARFNRSPSPGAANRPTLGAMAKHSLWPTPTSSLGTKGGRVTARKSREGGTLIEAVSARAFPTPSSNDWKGSTRGGNAVANSRTRTCRSSRLVAS
ncbi:MAG: DNA cytosine methyltransferase [Comamonadaceae bacterium]|nr:DNA cytosine methyltransferase [Comamonadaceae bacterium]